MPFHGDIDRCRMRSSSSADFFILAWRLGRGVQHLAPNGASALTFAAAGERNGV
jgi:hypothetical protein